jgi:putative Mn2+ efflux pump MntP
MTSIFTLLLVGLSVGLGNFAASVAIGLSGVDRALRIRIALVFGIFEAGMPIVGLVLGRQIAGSLGNHANIIGGILLGITGLYVIIGALREADEPKQAISGNLKKLLLTGLALSIDNLIVGFSLGTFKQSLLEAAAVIGITSIALSLIGLEVGRYLKSWVEE